MARHVVLARLRRWVGIALVDGLALRHLGDVPAIFVIRLRIGCKGRASILALNHSGSCRGSAEERGKGAIGGCSNHAKYRGGGREADPNRMTGANADLRARRVGTNPRASNLLENRWRGLGRAAALAIEARDPPPDRSAKHLRSRRGFRRTLKQPLHEPAARRALGWPSTYAVNSSRNRSDNMPHLRIPTRRSGQPSIFSSKSRSSRRAHDTSAANRAYWHLIPRP